MTGAVLLAPEETWREDLPPAEYWAIDPSKTMRTPVDSRGLIIVDELVEGVKAYVCPEYEWNGPSDIHHLYFYAAWYELTELESGGAVPSHRFRELPVNKLLIPRLFHNVLHAVTEPAAMPSPTIMRYYIDAWTAARDLFVSVRKAVHVERMSRRRLEKAGDTGLTPEQEEVGQEIIEETLRRHFRGISRHLGALSLLPEEFRPFDLDRDVRDAMGQLGDILLHGRQRQTRAARLPVGKQKPCACLHCKLNSSIITPVNN
jgi:hypothetical protein